MGYSCWTSPLHFSLMAAIHSTRVQTRIYLRRTLNQMFLQHYRPKPEHPPDLHLHPQVRWCFIRMNLIWFDCLFFFLSFKLICCTLRHFVSVYLLEGKRSNIHRSESSESFQRRGLFNAQGSGEFSSLPAKDSVPDPFALPHPTKPRVTPTDSPALTKWAPPPSPPPDPQ